MKKLLFLAIFTFLIAHANSAYAFTYSRDPSGDGTYQQMQFDVDPQGEDSPCGASWNIKLQTDAAGEIFLDPLPLGTPTIYTQDFSTTANIVWVIAECTAGPQIAILEGDGSTFLFAIEPYIPPPPPPATNQVWGTDNAFFGSSSPVTVLASISGGVTDTGVSLWPLLIFLGIGIAFIIGNMLVGFIKQSTQIKTVKKKEDFIYHNADDLEFKRDYGKE
jgi:hypothetical protein